MQVQQVGFEYRRVPPKWGGDKTLDRSHFAASALSPSERCCVSEWGLPHSAPFLGNVLDSLPAPHLRGYFVVICGIC